LCVVSLAFYESLGFVQAGVGEAWPHPYGVVTDGRVSVGLHAIELDGPLLTWSAPSLRTRLDTLAAVGIEADAVRLDDSALNRALLHSPSGQGVQLLEARTFSPPALAPGHSSRLGYFEEYAWPVSTADFTEAQSFWESLGFVAFDAVTTPFDRIVASSRDLNVALYDIDLRSPVLVFSAPDMAARIADLRERGYRFASRTPRALAATGAAVLEAPEGTALLLVDESVFAG
jgi:hypothetical protein